MAMACTCSAPQHGSAARKAPHWMFRPASSSKGGGCWNPVSAPSPRPVAREALLVLELIGVVDIRHGDGVYVLGSPARIGSAEGPALDVPPRELIEGRRMLEPGVCSLAAARMSATDIERIGQGVEEMAGLVDDLDQLPRFTQLGLQFHSDLTLGCGNTLLSDLVCQLVDTERHPLWTLINQHAMSTTAARQGQVEEHRAILR